MLIKVFSVLSMLSKLPPGVCWRGATGLLNKSVEFPQVQASTNNNGIQCACVEFFCGFKITFVYVAMTPWVTLHSTGLATT